MLAGWFIVSQNNTAQKVEKKFLKAMALFHTL
jgi:hypothetical protein